MPAQTRGAGVRGGRKFRGDTCRDGTTTGCAGSLCLTSRWRKPAWLRDFFSGGFTTGPGKREPGEADGFQDRLGVRGRLGQHLVLLTVQLQGDQPHGAQRCQGGVSVISRLVLRRAFSSATPSSRARWATNRCPRARDSAEKSENPYSAMVKPSGRGALDTFIRGVHVLALRHGQRQRQGREARPQVAAEGRHSRRAFPVMDNLTLEGSNLSKRTE